MGWLKRRREAKAAAKREAEDRAAKALAARRKEYDDKKAKRSFSPYGVGDKVSIRADGTQGSISGVVLPDLRPFNHYRKGGGIDDTWGCGWIRYRVRIPADLRPIGVFAPNATALSSSGFSGGGSATATNGSPQGRRYEIVTVYPEELDLVENHPGWDDEEDDEDGVD